MYFSIANNLLTPNTKANNLRMGNNSSNLE
jgi:hypothetical protein